MKKITIQLFILLLVLLSCATDKNNLCNSENQRLETDPSISGMDVSHFQGDIKWNDIKKDNVNYVYIKASEGADFIDPKFKSNRAAAKSKCIYRGAYHFYQTSDDPKIQVQNFISAVGQLEPGDLPPVLDLEKLGINAPITIKEYQENTLLWLQMVEKKLGVSPIIYTNLFFGIKYLDHPDFSKYKLWIAEYTKEKPKLPETWKNKGWTFWQRTDLKKLEGIKGKVDYDIFNGDAEAFRKLLKQ
ncbi:lysozyme [Aquimarina sp. MAR_2010_214]|uniref:glycoside hydrolase family 25 protein n=1 Tax=Aquimarina sp. MAR_2010_214 TaxID=1250026 RepID=UPI000C70DB8B|nr:GH25 family lysozyme [Aquimarina sp. MAR_2010_214]PKV52909.1 lysozyme [Aquimarina sp. MAR_2010_214]